MKNEEQLTLRTQKQPKTKTVLVVLLSFVVAGAGMGAYFWQHNKVRSLNDKISHLQTELNTANKSSTSMQNPSTTSDTFTYSPKTGGLSLTLPKTFGIVVNVDGNKGGAPGATFRVASTTNSNIFSDPAYQGVQVDVDHIFTTLDHAVSSEESFLDEQRGAGTEDRMYKVSDTTVAGLPAKLLTADGLDEYQGQLSVYLVGSGSFMYKITANGIQFGDPTTLTALLKGIGIKPVTL